MTMEQQEHDVCCVGKKKTRQLDRVKRLLGKVKRPYNESKYMSKSRSQLNEIIRELREEARLQ